MKHASTAFALAALTSLALTGPLSGAARAQTGGPAAPAADAPIHHDYDARPGAAAAPAARYNGPDIAISPGTTIPLVMDSSLSSTQSRRGQTFSAHVDYSQSDGNGNDNDNGDRNDYDNALPEGTRVYGHVTGVQAKNGNQTGELGLTFDRIVLPGGRAYGVRAVPGNVGKQDVSVDNNGNVVAKSDYTNVAGRDAAIGAAAGLVGDLLLNHGNVNLGHVLLGGAAGYGVSTVNKAQSTAQDVKLKPGSRLGMRVTQPFDLGRGRGGY